MKIIKDEIRKELQRDRIDELYLNALMGIDKLGMIDADFYKGSGRVYTRDEFKKERPKARLFDSCIEVIRYIGGYYIQFLQSGFYMIDLNDGDEGDEVNTIFAHRELSAVEDVLWETTASKLFKE